MSALPGDKWCTTVLDVFIQPVFDGCLVCRWKMKFARRMLELSTIFVHRVHWVHQYVLRSVKSWNLKLVSHNVGHLASLHVLHHAGQLNGHHVKLWCELNGAKRFMGQGTNEQGDSRSRMFLAFAWFHIVQWTMFTFELICAFILAQYHFFFTIHPSAFIRLCFACYGAQLR